jgi:hypothetical protein
MPDLNWAAIEAFAAVAGVIGVIISIIFLIYEVRHNAAAIEGATVQSLMSLEREVFSLMADNAALMTKGAAGRDALEASERYAYDRSVGCYMSLIYSAFIQYERDLVDEEVWDAYLNALARHIAAPGFADAWTQMKMGYPKSFRETVAKRFEV